MASSFHSRAFTPLPTLLLILFFFVFFIDSSFAMPDIVAKVCNKTTNYTYCVDALYSDPHTPYADAYYLAYISLDLAYLNATNTHDYISGLLRSPHLSPALVSPLQRCRHDYITAIRSFESAYNDLNLETFTDQVSYSRRGAHSAVDCRRTFDGSVYSPLLAVRNKDLKLLSEIFGVVSKLVT